MKIGAIPETLLERLAMAFGLVPIPFIETFHAVIVARAVMVATKLDVFDALAARPLPATALAAQLGLDAAALEKLLNLLIAIGYVKHGSAGFSPTRLARKWLMRDSPQSIRDNMLLRFLEWQAIEMTEEFVRTGKALDVHDFIRDEQWDIYQRGMRSLARLSASEVAARTPGLGNPLTMLDVGGGHGAYSAAFCRRYPRLKATILDLPQAVEVAAPLVAEEDLEERIVHKSGNAKTEDLGRAVWDIILVSHLVHHFDDAQNRSLLKRAADALRPNGIIIIIDVLRESSRVAGSQTGALLDFYFAITSLSGTFSATQVASWLTPTRLVIERIIPLRSAPGISVIVAKKAADSKG
jgi:2-polyprenyl-3-methyl-5-hydroxy-6-metoxy-1,4-benzoquinol methylase